MWRRTARRTLLLAWLLFLGLVAYLGTHPRLIAPLAARLVSRNLFHEREGSLRLRDFRGSLFSSLELHQVSLSLADGRGGAIAATVDTLILDYRLRELLGDDPRVRRVEARGAKILATAPSRSRSDRAPASARRGPWWPARLRLDAFVVDGALEVVGTDGRLRERLPAARCRGTAVAADGALVVEIRDAMVSWSTRASRIDSLWGRLLINQQGFTAEEVHLLLNGGPCLVSGSRDSSGALEVTAQARGISAAAISNLLETELGFAAEGDVTAHVQVRGDTVSFNGAFDGELEGYHMEGLRGWALSVPGALTWERLTGRVNGAWFDGAGRFDVTDPAGAEFWLEGAVADVDLSRGLVPAVVLPPSGGRGRVAIHRRDSTDETEVSGWLVDGFLADIPFDTCRVEVKAGGGVAQIQRLALRHRAQRVELTGSADTSGMFAGELAVVADDLSQLPEQWGWPPLAGRLAGRGAVSGQDPVYTFVGEATTRDLSLGLLRADSCQLALTIDDALRAPRVEGEGRGGGLALGGMILGDFFLRGGASSAGAALDSFRSVRGDSVVTARARAVFGEDGADYVLDHLAIDLEGNRWQLEGPTTLVARPSGLALSEFRLSSSLGSLRASGGFDRQAGTLAADCALRRFDLRLLNPFVPQAWDLEGDVTADVTLSGTPAAPVVSVVADLTGSEFPLARVDSLRVEASYAQRVVTIDLLDLRTQYGRVTARGSVGNPEASRMADFWPGARLGLSVEISDADWAFVDQFKLPSLARIAGRFRGAFRVAGTARDPVVDGEVFSEPFNVHWLHLQRLTGRIGLTATQLTLSDLDAVQGTIRASGRIELPLRADFLSTPISPPDGPFLMLVEIPDGTNLSSLLVATNAFAEAGGRGGMSMRVAGPLDHPLFSGRARVRDGRFVLKGLAEIYRDVQIDAEWDGDLLTLRDIRGASGARGVFTGDGLLQFKGLMLEGFDLRLDADRVLVASIPYLRALVRGQDLHVAGVKVGPDSLMVPKFSGQLEIIEARYSGDFAEKPGVSDPRLATVAPDWLADLHVIGPPRTTLISNRAMELAMSGDVDVVRDLDGMFLSGSMVIDSGRLPVFNNDFRVVSGRLDFSRATGVVPQVDLTAETTVRLPYTGPFSSRALERITALVRGSVEAPTVEFSSESGYGRAAIERLLLGLPPHAAESPLAGDLRDASIAAGFNLLEREIAAELKIVDTFDIESARAQATGETRRLIGVGKYLGQDLYVKYAQGLSEAERDLLIEYQINDHLLLQSEISRRLDVQLGNTTYNLDLKYRFEY